jgi:hypothetical protein
VVTLALTRRFQGHCTVQHMCSCSVTEHGAGKSDSASRRPVMCDVFPADDSNESL